MKTMLKRHNAIFYLILLIILSAIPYYVLLRNHINVWSFVILQFSAAVLWLFYLQKWILHPYLDFVNTLKSYICENSSIMSCTSEADAEKYPGYTLKEIIRHQHEQEKHHQQLLEQLRSSNILLERNNKITDSIMQITSEVLSSGEINETLQVILDKAIEIIPNAQKGSILIYDGKDLHYRAVRGYDFEVLKKLRLSIKEIFQYDSMDFYQPCIISNPESFNRKHLDSGKYEILKEGKGFELKSILSCAILVDGEFYGVINLDNEEDSCAFTDEDKPLIKHLSAQIGIALKNTMLIERILYLSRHDSLTGIYNRSYCEDLLTRFYHQCKSDGSKFSLLIFDINELKHTNDTYGHEAGDLLLKAFVNGVHSNIGANDIFARFGGDEFAVIFINKDSDDVEKVIGKIKAGFEHTPFTYCGSTIANITFGYGIAVFPNDAVDLDGLLRLADWRMYEDKKKSKNLS